MTSRSNGIHKGQKGKNFQVEGPSWILIAGGALLSTLSIRLGYMLKQTLDSKQQANATNGMKGNEKSSDGMLSNAHSFTQDGCYNCISDLKQQPSDRMLSESDVALPLVTVPGPEFGKENNVMWVSSPDQLELPPKPFHHSNCSDSPRVSDSGSDIFSKREVIQKLRQQVKRRDDMIMEMQEQILELQSALNSHLVHSTNLQSQLDSASRDLFDSEREIQRLRQAIADHCVKHTSPKERPPVVSTWPSGVRNGLANGYADGDSSFELSEKGNGERERIEMLKKEVRDLKEVIEGKEFLLQSYKDQKAELAIKLKELQHRLDSQLPNIL